MSEFLTKKEKEFADEYLETRNGTKAALKAYDTNSENMAAVLASRTIRKDKVRAYLEEKAEIASQVIFELATTSQQDNVRLGAAKDILDRAGHKPKDEVDVTTQGESLNRITDEQAERILSRRIKRIQESSTE